MAIQATVALLEQPYGNPGSLGEPLGLWSGDANVLGDATGGDIAAYLECRSPEYNECECDFKMMWHDR